jgi:hypothetical protein
MSLAEMEVKLSEEKARLLIRVGMTVTVRKYRGGKLVTKTASLPWKLSYGLWVVNLVGLEGHYDCGRVMPIAQKTGEFSLESEAA